MYYKYLILIFSTIVLNCASSEMMAIEEMYLHFFTQIENVKKSIDILKLRMDVINERSANHNCCSGIDNQFSSQVLQNFDVVKNSLNQLNIRLDNNIPDKYQELENRMNNYEIQQKTLAQELSDVKEKYINLLEELNEVKKSEENLKLKNSNLEIKYKKVLKNLEITKATNEDLKLKVNNLNKSISNQQAKDQDIVNFNKKPLFDVRIDKLPQTIQAYCREDPTPIDCQIATKCTQKSGYYKIFLPDNKTKYFMAYCDTETNGGGWLHILRRKDGSENFTRSWSDYVNGFGKVDGEYWIGLDNLHALTSKNGQQELYVHIEDFEGQTYFARYDNFVVADATEFYKLKSLGQYYGLGEDDMSYNVGMKFSTIDKDNDLWPTGSCAEQRQSGWWYNYCTYVQPSGQYLHGESSRDGILWRSFRGLTYSHKVINLMIRQHY